MNRVPRPAALYAALLPVLALPALAGNGEKQDKGEKPKPAVYKTPQECFDAHVAATLKRPKKDTRAAAEALTSAAQKRLAGHAAYQGLLLRAEAQKDEDTRKKYKALLAVLDRHRLTAKATAEVKAVPDLPTKKDREKLAKLIEDPAGFLAAWWLAADEVWPRPDEKAERERRPKLEGLKVAGDEASATMLVSVKQGDEWKVVKLPVKFEKSTGVGWRMSLDPPVREE